MFTYQTEIDPKTGESYVPVPIKGLALAEHPMYNKGTAFTMQERAELELNGIYPIAPSTLDLQKQKTYESFSSKQSALEKYIYLMSLQDRNETLHYALVLDHLTEMLPIVYTPTVGQACQQYSHIFRRPRGVYISPKNINQIDRVLSNTSFTNISLLVATDGERILGLGDLGAGGMGIPIGKISLYITAAGLHPSECLPVMLDVGTNNEELLNDPLYIGIREKRLTGDAYDDFIKAFVDGVKRKFPHALLQWEDIGKNNAFRILEKNRKNVLSFNDDIQGTGAVATAVLLNAMKIKGEKLRDQQFVMFGQGQAGLGIARQIVTALKAEGLNDQEAHDRIFGIDINGLLVEGMTASDEQRPFLKSRDVVAQWELSDPNKINLLDVLRNTKASVLIGVTGQSNAFNEDVIKALAKNTDLPVILPLSNPTAKAECRPQFALDITDGKCLLATGSPFEPVEVNGTKQVISQCNNLFIFPGVGLGALVSQTPQVTDSMFMAGSLALSRYVTPDELQSKQTLPSIEHIRDVTLEVALAVAIEARELGLGISESDDTLRDIIKLRMWEPRYLPYRYVGK